MSDFLSKRLVSVIRLGLEICCEDVDSEQRSSPKSQETVVNAIQKAFVSLDNDVLSTAKKAIEDPKMPLAQAVNNVVLAYAGSCAVVSLCTSPLPLYLLVIAKLRCRILFASETAVSKHCH